MHLSWGSVPLQRTTESGARMSRRIPISGTVRPQGFSPSRRLPSPKTMQALFHARCAHGVPVDLRCSPRSFDRGRATAPAFPLQGVLLIRDGHVLACPPLVRFVCFPIRDGFPSRRGARRALQSLDRKRVGIFPGCYPGTPALLRFLADLYARGFEALPIPGFPLRLPGASPPSIQPLQDLHRLC
jgi:hypothetical protein